MSNNQHYLGRSGFFWFHGVVEDRTDPDKLGRLKVRILGCHTQDKSYIKSEDLQWAYVMQPITSAAMCGIGQTPLGPVPGTWVIGFFRDGDDMQEPCIIGTIGGIPQYPAATSVGFNDPRGYETAEKLSDAPRKVKTRKYPKDGSGASLSSDTATNYPIILGEPDTNRIARNEQIAGTIIQTMRDNLDKGVAIPFGGTWDEKSVWFDGKYPFVHVYESESGHIQVTDDTPGKEGTLDWNRTGTFTEVLTDGSEVHKIVKNGYTIILSKNHIHVMNDQNERLDKECNISIGGRWNVEVEGNINLYCHSNVYAQVDGDLNVTAKAAKVSAKTVDVKSDGDVNVSSGGKLSIQTAADFHIAAGGIFAVDAEDIHLNSGVSSPNSASPADTPKK